MVDHAGQRVRRSIPLVAFLILTLAITAATVTFSVVDTIVLRALPYARSEKLIAAEFVRRNGQVAPVAPQDFLAWRDRAAAFDGVAAFVGPVPDVIEIAGQRDDVRRLSASSDLLRLLDVAPLLGRSFTLEDERSENAKVALISRALWTRRFGGRPEVLSESITIRGARYAIVGVLPDGVEFPIEAERPLELWLPLTLAPIDRVYDPARGRAASLRVVGRLRDDRTIDHAYAELGAITGVFANQYPSFYQDFRINVRPLREALLGRVSGWMMLVLWAVVLVLLLACVNVANLLLVRGSARQREIAIRAAMGATRGRIARSLVGEAMLIAAASGAAGLLLSSWAIRLVRDTIPLWIPRAPLVSLDARVFAAALAATALTGLVCGAIPAWRASRADLISLIKSGNVVGSGAASGPIRRGLILAQIAIVAIVLVSTTLFVTSFVKVTTADLGFNRHNLIEVSLPPVPRTASLSGRTDTRDATTMAIEAVRAVPGVSQVAVVASGGLPFDTSSSSTNVTLPGASDPATGVSVERRNISPGYLAAVGTRVIRGRDVVDRDVEGSPYVVLLDERAADALFGSREPLGATVSIAGFRDFTVVGITENIRLRGPEQASGAQAYFALAQSGGGLRRLAIRTAMPAGTMVPAIVAAVAAQMPPGAPPASVRVLDDIFRDLTADRRFNAAFLSAFGVLALVIGAAGIYGVVSFSVQQRTREIAIRSVLGATRARVTREVLADAAGQVVPGAVIGLAVAWMTSSMLEATLFGVSGSDWRVYAQVLGIVGAAGVAAALIPARRAARLDPGPLFK